MAIHRIVVIPPKLQSLLTSLHANRYCDALFAICLSASLWVGLTATVEHFDDAYITYRYARNLVIGQGYLYNAGEHVLGTTAPLYGILLAAIGWLGVDAPIASQWLSVLGWVACAILIYRLGSKTDGPVFGLLAAATVAASPLFFQVIGMETNLTIALSLAAFALYLEDHSMTAFGVAALATWMRFDSVLVAFVLGVIYLVSRRRIPYRESIVFGLTLAPWLLISFLFYGSIVPNTFFAKVGQGANPGLGAGEIGSFGTGLIRLATDFVASNPLYFVLGLCVVFGLVYTLRQRPRWSLVVLWTALYIAAYLGLAVLRFTWYYPPIWPAVALLSAAGIMVLARLQGRVGSFARGNRVRMAVVMVLGLLVLLPQWDGLWQAYRAKAGFSPYYRGYREVSEWLQANTAPDASVAMIEIGMIGYYSDRRVVDTMGLVSPDMVGHLSNWEQTLNYAVSHYWPDYAVALDGTAWDFVTNKTWFAEAYQPVVVIPSAGPGSRTATIYRRAAGFPITAFKLNQTYDLLASDYAINLRAIRADTTQLRPTQTLHVQLEWHSQRKIADSYLVLIDLIQASDGRRWPLAAARPVHDGEPTPLWRPGETIFDDYTLAVPDGQREGAYELEVKLYDETLQKSLHFVNRSGRSIPHVLAGPLWVGAGLPLSFAIGTPFPATFGSAIHLLGFDTDPALLKAGSTMPITLYWQASEPLYDDYTVFVHLYDDKGRLVAQQDGPPSRGKFPTSQWLPSATVQDVRELAVPANLPPGEYSVRVGLYRLETGERLPVASASGQVLDHAVELASVLLR